MKRIQFLGLFILAAMLSVNTFAQTKMVGGAEMYPTKNIVENAVNSKDDIPFALGSMFQKAYASPTAPTDLILDPAASEAFDEPLTKDQIVAIVTAFFA